MAITTLEVDVDPSPITAGRCESCRADDRRLFRVTFFADGARVEVCRECLPVT